MSNIDAFIQFDPSKPLARLPRKGKNYLIAYDIIPYILKYDYLPNYNIAKTRGLDTIESLRCSAQRYLYRQKVVDSAKKAFKIMAISETTKRDFVKIPKYPSTKNRSYRTWRK